MTLRINNNVSALNTHRNVVTNSLAQAKNLEKLSSGLEINRGADGPAKLQISEQLRAQTAGLKQAIDNTEMGISMMQTAEAAMDELSRALVQARQLAVHAANTGTNDEFMQLADQQELDNILHEVNTIAKNTQYGKKFLLDGSRAGNGVTTGAHLEFVGADHLAKSAGPGGHKVTISQQATRSEVKGMIPLTQAIIDAGEQIVITEDGRTVNFRTQVGQTVEQNMNQLKLAIEDAGLNIELVRPSTMGTDGKLPQQLQLRHKEFGSEHYFQVTTNTPGLLSKQGDVADWIQTGLDVDGEIAGEEAFGRGQILTGGPGSGVAEGLKVRYTNIDKPVDPMGFVGTVTFMQNSVQFQTGQNVGHNNRVSLKSMRAAELGNGIPNETGFRSLNEISLLDGQKALDSMQIIDRAIEEVAASRGELGAFQKNLLESNINYLRIAHENTLSSESVVRDADMAKEMSNFTRNQIMMESSVAMLAQSNARPLQVLKLLQ